jgi:hypothetical protein
VWYFTNASDGIAPTDGTLAFANITDQALPWK